jgi:hypothetical protein
MPIFDQGYSRWEGEISPHPLRWWPILRRGFLPEIRRRFTLFVLVFSWAAILVRGAILYGDLRSGGLFTSSGLMEGGVPYFFRALSEQGMAVILVVLLSGSLLIARDKRYNALQLYFSRPLTPNDYILGKLGIVVSFIFAVTWLPVMFLWLFAVGASPQEGYFAAVWSVPLRATLYCAVWSGTAGLLVLAVSAAATRGVIIAASWLLLYGALVVDGVTRVLTMLTGWDFWPMLNLSRNIEHLGSWIFGAKPILDYHPVFSLLLVVGAGIVSYLYLRMRIRPVETVL